MPNSKVKVTAHKFMGDDKFSWAVFRSDRGGPVYTGLSKSEVPHYKKLVEKMIEGPAPIKKPGHDCWKNAVPYESDGALGHGWECGTCGKFLQAG